MTADVTTGRQDRDWVEEAVRFFERHCRRHPEALALAPGRVNLIGEHTDYNAGFVLPMAIEQSLVVAAARRAAGSRLISARHGEYRWDSDRLPTPESLPLWARYVVGVVAGLRECGLAVPAVDLAIVGDLPSGSGLSSSAALEVAVATALEGLCDVVLDPSHKAHLCQRAEHLWAGVPCGIMDQLTVVRARADHALLLDCRDETCRWIPLGDRQVSVVICDTQVRHTLAGTDSPYAERRRTCELAARRLGLPALRDLASERLPDVLPQLDALTARRVRHVVSENERTLQMATALERADYGSAGALMYASHRSLRDDYQVSCPELDTLVDLAAQLGAPRGVYGARMTGAGFGGCVIVLAATAACSDIVPWLAQQYLRFTSRPLRVLHTRAAAGARLLHL
ncbi:MAG: galactokinase [Gemmataceae bacterium]